MSDIFTSVRLGKIKDRRPEDGETECQECGEKINVSNEATAPDNLHEKFKHVVCVQCTPEIMKKEEAERFNNK